MHTYIYTALHSPTNRPIMLLYIGRYVKQVNYKNSKYRMNAEYTKRQTHSCEAYTEDVK